MLAFGRWIGITILACGVSHCQGTDDVGYDPRNGFQPSGGGQTPMGDATGVPGAGVSTPVAGVDLLNSDNAAYPTVEFCGAGNVQAIENSNPTQVATRQVLGIDKVESHTTRFTSSDSDVNKEVVKLTGVTTFTRVPKTELAYREKEDGFKNEPFLMFANGSSGSDGNGSLTLKFSAPLPFVVIPTEMRRYDSLKNGPISFNNITVRDGSGVKLYVLNTTVSELSRSGNIIRIQVINDITSDTNGSLYSKLSLPRTSIFEINTDTKKAMRLETATYYYFEREKKRREITANLQLSSYTVRGNTERHASCP